MAFARLLVWFLVLFVAAGPAGALTLNNSLSFASEQSQFGGDTFEFSDERFLGAAWDESDSTTVGGGTLINGFCLGVVISSGCTGVNIPDVDFPSIGVSGNVNGAAGFTSNLAIDSGAVQADIPVQTRIDIPDLPQPRHSTLSLPTSFTVDPSASFSTSTPNLTYGLGFVMDMGGGATVAGVDVLPQFTFGAAQAGDLIGYPSVEAEGERGVALFQVDGQGNVLDPVTPPGVPTPLEVITSTPALQDPLLRAPDVEVTDDLGDGALMGSGDDVYASITFDMDGLATSLLGMPPLEFDFSLADWVGVPAVVRDNAPAIADALGLPGLASALSDLDLEISYNLFDVDFVFDQIFAQTFTLDDFDLTGTMALEDGTEIPFTFGEDVAFDIPDGVGPTLDVDVFVDLAAMFTNDTDIQFSLGCVLRFFGFTLDLPFNFSGVTVDPQMPACNIGAGTSLDVFNQEFALNFNQEMFSFQVAVPEPSTLALLGAGLAAGGLALRRRRR